MKKLISLLLVLVLISVVVTGLFQATISARVVSQAAGHTSFSAVANAGLNNPAPNQNGGVHPKKPMVGWNS